MAAAGEATAASLTASGLPIEGSDPVPDIAFCFAQPYYGSYTLVDTSVMSTIVDRLATEAEIDWVTSAADTAVKRWHNESRQDRQARIRVLPATEASINKMIRCSGARILHLSGHGFESGFVAEHGVRGSPNLSIIDHSSIRKSLCEATSKPTLVFLACCSSNQLAFHVCAAGVPFVVATK